MMHRAPAHSQQQGIALVVGLILLLVATLLGITAIRSTTQQERMAANAQQQITTFQIAESAIRRMMGELRGQITPPADTTRSPIIAALNPASPVVSSETTRTPQGGVTSGVTANAVITYVNTSGASGYRLGVEQGSFVCYNFNITSTATQAGSNAFDQHIQGVCRVGPRP